MMDIINSTHNESLDSNEAYFPAINCWDVLQATPCVVSGLANILIIYVISRYRALKTRPNAYLANWCICNLIVLLLVPTQLSLFGCTDSISYELLCFTEETQYGMLIANLLFVMVLFLEWYSGYHGRPTCLTNRFVLFAIIGVVWTTALIISSASVTFCILDMSYPLSLISFNLVYISVFAVIISIHIFRLVMIKIFKKPPEKNKLELIIVTSYFFCWLPHWLLTYGQMFLGFYVSPTYENLTYFFGYSHAFIMLNLLYFCDKYFKKYLRECFGLREKAAQANLNKEQNTGLL